MVLAAAASSQRHGIRTVAGSWQMLRDRGEPPDTAITTAPSSVSVKRRLGQRTEAPRAAAEEAAGPANQDEGELVLGRWAGRAGRRAGLRVGHGLLRLLERVVWLRQGPKPWLKSWTALRDVALDEVGVEGDGGRGAVAGGGDDLGARVGDVAGDPDAGDAGARRWRR